MNINYSIHHDIEMYNNDLKYEKSMILPAIVKMKNACSSSLKPEKDMIQQ